jgi:ectoine hydrolase
MPDVDLPFTRAEYAERLARVRASMAAHGIELLLVTDPSNMHWLTGYDGWSFYVHQGVLLAPAGEPVFWGRAMDAAGALRTAWMDEENIVGYPDDYVMSGSAHAMQHLAWTIRERGWEGLALATEHENYYYTAKAHAVLAAEFGREPMDATGLVNWQRAVKSETELRYMRRAARISESVHQRILELMEPGRRKNEIAAEIYHAAIWGADEEGVSFGGDYPAIAPLMPTGLDATAAHLTWDDTPFARGAGTFFEISGCHRRYHAPLCRTIYLGEPPAEMRAAEEAVLEGTHEAIEAARPGNTAGDVAHAFYAVLARHGIPREGRCGYPIGLSYPPDWGERTFSLRPSDETVLRPGMTFHFMPALWMEEWGLEITEPLLVADDGPAECLCQYPRQLFVKP